MAREKAEELLEQSAEVDYEGLEAVGNGDVVNTYVFHQGSDRRVLQFPRTDIRGFEVGLNLYEELANSGIPVPEIVSREKEGRNHVILEHLPGEDLIDVERPDREVFYESGRILAEIHDRYDFGDYGFLSPNDFDTRRGIRNWDDFFYAHLNTRLKDLEGDFIDESEYSRLEKIVGDVPKQPEQALLHNDFRVYNIRVDSGVEAVLDFDSAMVGDPEYELVHARQSFRENFDEEAVYWFEQGYRSERELSGSFYEKERLYQISGHIEEAYAEKRLAEMGRKDTNREEIEGYVSSALNLLSS